MNISHVNIENMGGRDQSQVKIKFKKFEKVKSVPKDVPKCHNDDTHASTHFITYHIHLFQPRTVHFFNHTDLQVRTGWA